MLVIKASDWICSPRLRMTCLPLLKSAAALPPNSPRLHTTNKNSDLPARHILPQDARTSPGGFNFFDINIWNAVLMLSVTGPAVKFVQFVSRPQRFFASFATFCENLIPRSVMFVPFSRF